MGSGDAAGITAEADAIMPPTPTAAAAMRAVDLTEPELAALDEWMEDIRVLNSDGCLGREAAQDRLTLQSRSRQQGCVKAGRAVASPMRIRTPAGVRSPSGVFSPPSSPSKKDMARLAEQRAMEWAAGQSPRPKTGQKSPSRRTPKSPLLSTRGGLLGAGSDLPATPERAPASMEPASAVERQLDDILNELDEIDRIHDDVCMLARS